MPEVVIKRWGELTQREIDELNWNQAREWNVGPMREETHQDRMFFLLEGESGGIVAHGQLLPIHGVVFDDQAFDILGIAGIIANPMGQGFGRRLMLAMKDHLTREGKPAVGFTGVPEFYRKCGYSVDREVVRRLVHVVDGRRITNTVDEWVLFLDAGDRFMERVLAAPEKDVYLPRDPDW